MTDTIPVPFAFDTLDTVAPVRSPLSEPFSDERVHELTSAILRGSEPAFDLFYAHYSPRIYRLLIVVTRGDEDLSRELHQNVMIKTARKLKVFHSGDELWSWLAQIARNSWKDVLRRRLREQKGLDGLQPSTPDSHQDENLIALQAALESLEPSERDLVNTFYFDHIPQKDLAMKNGRTIKAIQCELARIRQKLRKLLSSNRSI